MKKYILNLLLINLILLMATSARAGLFSQFSVKDGLSNRKVYGASKDENGYIWLATHSGVNKYNGEEFLFYELPQLNVSGNEHPKGIITTANNKIYVYSDKHIYIYNNLRDVFETVNDIKYNSSETITALTIDEKGTIWIGTTEGLYYITLNKDQRKINFERNRAIYDIAPFENKIYLATSHGIKILEEEKNDMYKILKSKGLNRLNEKRIQSLWIDHHHENLWIGTFSDGLKVFNLKSRSYTSKKRSSLSFPIRDITAVSKDKIWIATDGSGIKEYNRTTFKLINTFSQSSPGKNNLKANGIYDLLNDNNLVWVCSYTAGIFIYNKNQIISKIYDHKENNRQSLTNNQVNAILEDSHNNLLFGTDKGLSIYNTQNKRWQHFLEQKSSDHSVVLCIEEDHQNKIWTGGYASDLSKIDLKTNRTQTIDIPNKNRKKNYIYSIYEDDKKNIWLGGIIDNLTQYRFKDKKFLQYKIKGINRISAYNSDSLLLATNHGIFIFNEKTTKIHPINLKDFKGDSVTHAFPFVNSICVDNLDRNKLWIGTEGDGIYLINLLKRSIKNYTNKDGLSANNVCGILMDDNNRIWVSTENGLNCIIPEKSLIETFYEIDGLPSNSFNFLAYTKRRNGNLIFGTTEGAVEINPSLFSRVNQPRFNLVFENFSLFYDRITPTSENSPLKENINEIKEIDLKHNQHSFSFDFINLTFTNNLSTLYTWKLEGFDERWSKPSTKHQATYTNIPPGNYEFKVKVYRADNKARTCMRTINIYIAPPFWATGWAIAIYIILGLLVTYAVIRVYKDRLDAKDSEQKIRFFVNIAHDIRTPLTLIKAPLNEIENEPLSDNAKGALQLAKKNIDKLLNVVTQLMDFQKIEREAMNLHVEKSELNQLIYNNTSNFQILAKEKKIDLVVDVPDEEHMGWIDRQKLNIILDNLISNSIKYTRANGKVEVKVSYDKNINIEITDNGIGVSAKEQNKLFKRFYRAENAVNSNQTGTGIGLILTKKMVLLHKGSINFKSEENVGTTFSISIPIEKECYSKNEIIVHHRADIKATEEHKHDENNNEQTDEKNMIKLLLVEDNEELRNYLANYLGKSYKIITADNGEEGVNSVKKHNPDFILSDVLMPKMSGFELCKKLKSNVETCHIPIILLTSLSEKESIIKGFKAGADDYITKPFDLSVLESKINAIIQNRVLFRKKYIDKSAFDEQNTDIVNDIDKKFMQHIVEFIEEQMANEKFNIDSIALEMAMSRSVLYKKMKSLTGQTPQDFIRDMKMKKASKLLKENKYSIGEIAYLTGYPNSKYFSTAFKKYYGCTPSNYKEDEKEL